MSAPDTLQRVSLLLVLCGLAVLYGSSTMFEPPVVSVSDVDADMLGDTVRVPGTVTSHEVREEVQFLRVNDGEEGLKAVYFGDNALDVVEGDQYVLEGTVDVYHGELELIVSDVLPAEQ